MTTVNNVFAVLACAILIYVIIVAATKKNEPSKIEKSINAQLASTKRNQDYIDDEQPLVGYQYVDEQTNDYNQYYIAQENPNRVASDSCLALPRSSADCINRRLIRNGEDLQDAVNVCKVKQTVLSSCAKNIDGYYYPYSIDYPFDSDYPERQTREAYVIRTSLNAPQEKVLMVKINDSI